MLVELFYLFAFKRYTSIWRDLIVTAKKAKTQMLKQLVGISKEHKSVDGNAYVIDTRIWERHFPITSDLKFDGLKAIPKSGSL